MNTVNLDIHTVWKYEILDAATVFLNLLNRFIQKTMIQSETKLQCTAIDMQYAIVLQCLHLELVPLVKQQLTK